VRIWRSLRERASNSSAEIDQLDNLAANRRIWNEYAAAWTPRFRGYEADHEGEVPIEYSYLGDEWGHPRDVDDVVRQFVLPYIDPQARVAEVGAGGGRVAARVVDHTRELWCFDISENMLDRARVALAGKSQARFVHIEGPGFPPELAGTFDFIYCFDVMVHFDLHMMWRYLSEFARLVRPGGRFLVHTANIATSAGWEHFASQEKFTVPTHYFVTPETVLTLASHLPVTLVHRAEEDPANFYLGRDLLMVFERTAGQA